MGGVLPLAAELERVPDARIVVYHRVSSYGQAGRGKCKLEQNTSAVVGAVQTAAPGRHRTTVQGVEEGRLTCPRKALARAVRHASCLPKGMIVAADVSRFIRAGNYDRRTNSEAIPTPEEFARLREFTRGIPLATLADPSMTESQRHSLATRRAGTAGRPSSISPELAAAIFGELGWLALLPRGWRWKRSLAEVAREFGVSVQAIGRAADTTCPTGETWRWEAIRRAAELGLHQLRGDEIRGYEVVMRSDG